MNACVPVVSDIPVFHEVAGEAALYFNPRDPLSLCEAVHQAGDQQCRNRVLAAAKQNAATFSWDDAAAAVLKTYDAIQTGATTVSTACVSESERAALPLTCL